MSRRLLHRTIPGQREILPIDHDFVNNLDREWWYRYKILFKIYLNNKGFSFDEASRLAYNDVKTWMETGELK